MIMIENKKSKADIYVRSYREHFGLWNYDSLFFFVLFVCCLLRYYVYIFYVTRTILGLTFLHPDTTIETDFLFLFLFIRISETPTMLV